MLDSSISSSDLMRSLRNVWITACSLLISTSALADDPIWHCSRSLSADTTTQAPNQKASGNTSLSFDLSESTTIEILPIDLFQIYSGGTVLFGKKPLAACFLDRNNDLTEKAMNMLDIEPSSLNSLAMIDSIVQSKIYPIRNQDQMKVCIAKHHPALGYLSEVVETDLIGPCF